MSNDNSQAIDNEITSLQTELKRLEPIQATTVQVLCAGASIGMPIFFIGAVCSAQRPNAGLLIMLAGAGITFLAVCWVSNYQNANDANKAYWRIREIKQKIEQLSC